MGTRRRVLHALAGVGRYGDEAQPVRDLELLRQDWWTLGFEATGPADLLRSALEATAALLFAQALPGGVEPGQDESRSYAEWLGQWPGRKTDA